MKVKKLEDIEDLYIKNAVNHYLLNEKFEAINHSKKQKRILVDRFAEESEKWRLYYLYVFY